MRKLLVPLICLFFGSIPSLYAQTTAVQTRDAEWKSYALPQTNFARYVVADQPLVFRYPADWKQEPNAMVFAGPHNAVIRVTPQTVPDGYPLTEYVAGVLRGIGDVTGSSASILTRRTQFQDLEAREIYVESADEQGNMFRSTTWITISGPLVVVVNMLVPVEHATAMEPFFKATVQSVMFVPTNFSEFESLRSTAIKTPAAGPIHDVYNVITSLNELNSDREAAINRLTPLFVSQPQTVVDLLVDRRVAVRSAAAEALARSKNVELKRLLWHAIADSDPFVAAAAARRLGQENDVVAQILNRSWTRNAVEQFARVWPFMSKENRVRFMQGLFSQTTPDRDVQAGALTLLGTMTPAEFKLPLARIMTSNYNPLTIVALQVANYRGDLLPIATLMKLAGSSNEKIQKLAIESMGQCGAVSDIPQLEALLSKTPTPSAANDKKASARKALDDEIKLSIKKIRFRHDLGLAKGEPQWREIIRKTASDSSLDDFAWRFDCELSISGCSPATAKSSLPPQFKVKPFAENLFPREVTHFTAIPNPGQAVQRLYETVHGLQLDSPRAQANLVMVLGRVREALGQQLGAPFDASALIDYTGIKSDSPIVLGAWTAAGAPDSVSIAQRRAVVLRVNDRERFERVVEKFQQESRGFTYLTDYVAVGTRAAAALPALLPLSAQATLAAPVTKKPSRFPALNYSFVGETEWNGIPITSVEHRWIDFDSDVHGDATHIAYIGDVAILAQDMATMRELLSNATAPEQQLLAGNDEFRHATANDGDIVYFSNLKAVFARVWSSAFENTKKANESGALKFSNSTWENSHRVVFDESEWSKPLMPFHPKELSAPRELLPSSTLAYYLMKLDVAAAQQTWPKAMNLRENRLEIEPALWGLDFKKDVAPELGPECGAVLLELSNFDSNSFEEGTWAAFCKLKTNKLSEAFTSGKLFRGVGPTTGMAEVKSGDTSYFVAIKNGFLVVSNKSNGLSALGSKENLAATRDYSRAAEKVPAGIVAFGGYNLEAAISAASANATDGLRAQMAGVALSIASAFHSQSFFATAAPGAIEGRSSVAMDREGRYAVADFSYLPRGANITYVTLDPHGLPIVSQKRLSNLVLRLRSKTAGPIDSIKGDINTPKQTVEHKSPTELIIDVAARRISSDKKIQLPVTNPEVATFLKATGEIASDNRSVIEQARQIAGDDRDAWSVARKLADWTYKNLKWKSVARAGAAETLATREADCSEFSELYVAMARSLGLPARMVSGLAYSGNSFGGHAWVEVWVGEWVELDPTWGTDFVDATHIRNENSALVTAAALNLIDIEVLETRRAVAEFQKSPKGLAEHVVKAIGVADKTELEAAIDLQVMTDEVMGQEAWNGLNEHEREQMSSGYRRALNDIIEAYGNEGLTPNNVHLLNVNETGERAEALCYVSSDDMLVKLQLLRRNDVWYLIEVVDGETGIRTTADTLQPVIKSIAANRAGKKTPPGVVSELSSLVTLLENDTAKGIEAVNRLLQTKPGDQTLRLLKAFALEGENDDEATKLLTELINEQPPFVPAVYRLARLLHDAKPEQALELYKRYTSLEPYDPRGHRDLGWLYEMTAQNAAAEAAYRKAIAVDPREIRGYVDLVGLLIRTDQLAKVGPVLAASDKYVTSADDLMALVLSDVEEDIKLDDLERLAASESQRVKTSMWANLTISNIYRRHDRNAEALTVIARAALIDPKSPEPHIAFSAVYLKQSRWNDARKAADHAVSLDDTNATAYYMQASALARLGRKRAAMTALERSIDLDPEVLEWLPEDDDFKSLRTLPAFKKLLAELKKQTEESEPK